MTADAGRMNAQSAHRIACKYIEHLLRADRKRAFDLIKEEARKGTPIVAIYVDILQPAMYEIGRLWQTDEIDIAVEHYCTAATQLLMAQLFPYALSSTKNGMKMVGCCLGNELHELGMRMVCDVFESSGWDTYFMGAITPGESLVNAVVSEKPDLVCLSATMPFGLTPVKHTIQSIHDRLGDKAPKTLVGGLAFAMNSNLYKLVGADASAQDARTAVIEANRLMGCETHV